MTSHRICLPIISAWLVAGCTSTEKPSAYSITRTTTDQTALGARHRGAVGALVEWEGANATVDLDDLVRQVKIVARHRATVRQRAVARQRAESAIRHLPPAKKQAVRSKRIRYLAVETERNAESRGRKSVMIWDVTTSDFAGDDVYDVAAPPPVGARCVFETYSADYVGAGP